MSSITPTDRSQQTDEARSQREDYNDKEATLVKKQKKELQKLEAKQGVELQKVREEYGQEIESLRNKSREMLTERDEKHQKGINEIRNLYMEQLRRKQNEMAESTEAYKESYQDQIKKQKDITAQQQAVSERNFKTSINDRDRDMETFTEKTRDIVRKSIEDRSQKLISKNKEEISGIVDDRDNKLAHAREVQDEMKMAYETRIKDQERGHDQQLKRTNDNWEESLRREKYNTNSVLQAKNDIFKTARKDMTGSYEKALEDKLSTLDKAHDNLKDQVDGRIDRDVRSARNENQRLKNDNNINMAALTRLQNSEKKNLINQYEERMSLIDQEKADIFDDQKQQTAKRVGEVVDKDVKILQDTNRDHRMDMSLLELRNREDRANLQVEHKNMLDHVTNRSEEAVKKVMQNTTKSTQNLEKLHQENLNRAQGNYQDKLVAQRESQIDSIEKTTLRMEGRLREQELKAQARLDEVVKNYEEKIEKIQDDHKKDIAHLQESFDLRSKGQEKAQKIDMESYNQKTDMKLSQLEENHQKEIERLEKRHQEQMQSASKQIAYFKKKA